MSFFALSGATTGIGATIKQRLRDQGDQVTTPASTRGWVSTSMTSISTAPPARCWRSTMWSASRC